MITLEKLIGIVSSELGVDLTKNNRTREVIVARAVYYQLAMKDLKLGSSILVGKSVNKDHATVLHALKSIIPMLHVYYPDVHEKYMVLKKKFDVRDDNKSFEDKYYNILIKYNKLLDIYGNDIQKHKGDIDPVPQKSSIRFATYSEWKKQGTDSVDTKGKRQESKESFKARASRNMLFRNIQQEK
jgi:hypothetical protein